MVDDFTRRRWDKAENATKVEPAVALQILLDDIKHNRVNPAHIAIVMLIRDEQGDQVNMMQAGECTTLEVQGMLARMIITANR